MKIKKIGIVGAGQMGQGIAQVMATAGFEVILQDISSHALSRAMKTIAGSLKKLNDKGCLGETVSVIEARLQVTESINFLDSCDLIIEAATEKESIKLEIFKTLSEISKRDAILATNTSSISITKLAEATVQPEKVIGMHFMNPVPLMPVVEVINGLKTDSATTNSVLTVIDLANKTAIPVKDKPGFVLNRILIPMLNEAIFVLDEECANATQIDEMLKLGAAHPIGPLALADLIGLDTCLNIMEVLHTEFGDSKYRAAPLLRQMVNAGLLGRKSGQGFHDYR